MAKIDLAIGLIIAVGTMLVIPSPIGYVAKASTCSASLSRHGTSHSSSSTTSGSCSGGSAIRQGTGLVGAINAQGGSKSSCTAASAGDSTADFQQRSDSNGAVSCSSHSP